MSTQTATIPTLAYENKEFLESSDGRILRILAEYQEPLARFRRERIYDTVVFFGSARFHAVDGDPEKIAVLDNTGSTRPAAQGSQEYFAEMKKKRADAEIEMARYYEDARKLARMWTEYAMKLEGNRHRYVVTSGGGPGIMEAANRGAHEAGGKTIGLNIKLPFEQYPNPYITPELNFEFHYFFMRKFWFAYLAKALVVFPGGFGTLDEMFELLTLTQTNKLEKRVPVIIYGSKYWQDVINLDMLAEKGAIAVRDRDLFQFADTPEQAFDYLKRGVETLEREILSHILDDPSAPAPTAQELLGPDIARTRS